MRSTFAGLNTMYRGIVTNQLSLDTVGHNISNADTDGYSRQKVNQAATNALQYNTTYGSVMVGSGTDALSLTRARNVYADKQYWKENATQSYNEAKQTNYDKVEAIFNDTSNAGIQNALEEFYKAWVDLSANASTTSNRTTVIEQAKVFIDRMNTANTQMRDQIIANYDDMKINIQKVNDLSDQIVELNKNIAAIEATGTNANDLRDKRDLAVDEFSSLVNVTVYEDSQTGMYQLVSNGVSLVSGLSALHLQMEEPGIANKTYGLTDYTLTIKETDTLFVPTDGILKGQLDNITEDKSYMDKLTNMATFLLTTFNEQHRSGYGLNGNATDANKTDINFFGKEDVYYTWDKEKNVVIATGRKTPFETTELSGMEIMKALQVNTQLTAPNGTEYVCACGGTVKETITLKNGDEYPVGSGNIVNITESSYSVEFEKDSTKSTFGERTITIDDFTAGTRTITVYTRNETADGSNAVLLSALFNEVQGGTENKVIDRSIGTVSFESYYNAMMADLGASSEAMDDMVDAQAIIINQVDTWRSSTSGVNWNEELTNMIMFQQGYSACSRCLTTMDEMLDRLINNTGVVGR